MNPIGQKIYRIHAAVIDGADPASWMPFGERAPCLGDLSRGLANVKIRSVDPSLGAASISFHLQSATELEIEDLDSIVAVVVDGTDFSGQQDCPNFLVRATRLENLCFMLAKQKSRARWRKFGFRIWIIAPNDYLLLESRVSYDIKLKAVAALKSTATRSDDEPEVNVQFVSDQHVMAFVAKDAVKEYAQIIPLIYLEGVRA